MYHGDIAEDATIRIGFNTTTAAGVPITLGGTPALSVYKDANTAQTTAGVTLTVDFDGLTGHHLVTIDTSADAFYVTGSNYRVVVTTGTVDGTSVVGSVVGHFSIQNRVVASVTGAVGSVTGAVGSVTGNVGGSVASVVGAVGSVAGNVGGNVVGTVASVVGNVGGNVNGNVVGSVASVTAGVTLADDAITAGKFDESTAFPLKAADTGSTYLARRGADGDTLETLSDQLDAIAGSSGSGANVVTVTITDDDENPLQNATVRMTEGANSFTATTNVSGVATFALDNATYTLAITKAGYSFTPASRVVDGAEAFEEEMVQIAITPAANPDQTNAHLVTRDGRGNVQGDVTLEFQRVSLPGEPGHSYAGETFTDASDSETGILEVTLTRSTGYRVRRNYQGVAGPWVNFVTGGESTYLIPFYGLGASNPA